MNPYLECEVVTDCPDCLPRSAQHGPSLSQHEPQCVRVVKKLPLGWHLLVRLESKGGGVRESHFFPAPEANWEHAEAERI